MQMFKNSFRSITSLYIVAGLLVLAGGILFLLPRKVSVTQAENCQTVYKDPVFNPYPVSWTTEAGTNCKDFPVISGNVTGAGSWQSTFNAKSGDIIKLRIYVHNGAALNSGAIMKNVQVSSTIDAGSSATHQIKTTLSASNAASKTGQITINTGPNDRLEIISGSLNQYIGDMQPCFPFSKVFYIELKVVSDQTTPKTLKLTTDKASYCVGDIPRYTVNGSSNLGNKYIRWSSTKDNQSTGENQAGYGHYTNNQGDWSGNGGKWNSSHIGSWTKTAYAGGVNASASFTVKDCTVPVVQVTATATATASAKASATCPNGSSASASSSASATATATASTYSKAYNLAKQRAGAKAYVSAQASAQAKISCPATPPVNIPNLTCSPNNQTKNVNQSIGFTANGGTGSYSWTAVGSSSAYGSGKNFTTSYFTSGNKAVTVRSGSQTTNCSVTVKQPAQPQPIICPLSSKPNRTIVNFNKQSVVAWRSASDAQNGPYNVDLPAGRYNVTLVSYDDHVSKSNQNQPQEKYFLRLKNSSGNNVANTNSIADLPSSQNYLTQKVNSDFNLTQTVRSVFAVHPAYFNSNPNSITPVCAAFDRIEDQPQNTTLSITKEVKNITENGNFNSSVQASKNDIVEYRIKVKNTGNITAINARISDNFNDFGISRIGLINVSKSYSGSLNSGINVGNLSKNQTVIITYRARVNINNGVVTNTAITNADNTNSAQDTATVFVSTVVGQPELTIDKTVRNLSQGGIGFVNSVSARQDNEVEFKIVVINIGSDNAENVRVRDLIPSGLSPINGSVGTDIPVGGKLTGSGLLINNLSQGERATIFFRARINKISGSITNTASARADNTGEVSDNAFIDIIQDQTGSLSINKLVRNITSGGSFSSSAAAENGNRVEYQIIVAANSGTVVNVRLTDSLPSNLSVVNGSVKIDGNNSSDSLFYGGMSLGTMSTGQQKRITFEAFANSQGNNSQTIITNTATASGNNVGTVNDSATVYVNQQTDNGFLQLSISKSVRNQNSGFYQNSVNANNGETVNFEIVVNNTGNRAVNNVKVQDFLPSGFQLVNGTLRIDGNGNLPYNSNLGQVFLGSLNSGQQKRIYFDARVSAGSNTSIQNIARVSGDSVISIQDDAWVFVKGQTLGGNVSLSFSKRAINETKNVDATVVPASREDFITYTLTVSNNGNVPATDFVITDDLSQVLQYSDMVDRGGGTLNGNVITYPAITVPAYGSVSKSFKVRVKYSLADNLSYTMVNTYGNTVTVRINTPQVLGTFVAPKTGANTAGVAFGGFMVAAFALVKQRKFLFGLISKF